MSTEQPFSLEEQMARVRGRGRALVLMHDNPDPDEPCRACVLWDWPLEELLDQDPENSS